MVQRAQRTGQKVYGYVPTGYGARPMRSVEERVRKYIDWYGVDGIFFDETSTSSKWLSTYSGYTDFVKSLDWGVDTSSVKSTTAIIKPARNSVAKIAMRQLRVRVVLGPVSCG